MSRFYVLPENVGRKEIVVEGREARHIRDVMRLSEKDAVVVFDGTGREYSGFIKEVDDKVKKIVVEIVTTKVPTEGEGPQIVLAQALPKKGKMDYICEKATELGVSRIVPLVTSRTIVRPEYQKCRKMVSRWKKIVVEAAKQCGRSDVPVVESITNFKDIAAKVDEYDLVLFAYLADTTVPLKDVLREVRAGKVLIFIGPEGDFTADEVQMVDRENCRFVSLGRRVLKSDTAGLYALSVVGSELGI